MVKQIGQVQIEAWGALLTAHAALTRRMDRVLQSEGKLSLQIYDVLLALEEAPDRRLRMCDLAQCVVFDPSSLTRLVDRLESAGYVIREAHPSDRRSTFARLTPKGLKAREDSWPRYRELLAENFGNFLTDEAAQKMRDALIEARQGEINR